MEKEIMNIKTKETIKIESEKLLDIVEAFNIFNLKDNISGRTHKQMNYFLKKRKKDAYFPNVYICKNEKEDRRNYPSYRNFKIYFMRDDFSQ